MANCNMYNSTLFYIWPDSSADKPDSDVSAVFLFYTLIVYSGYQICRVKKNTLRNIYYIEINNSLIVS